MIFVIPISPVCREAPTIRAFLAVTGGPEGALLPWSGTFHSIGNRLLRRHAATLSLDPAFTVLDRADSADLMDLVRSDLGLARTRSRFPKKGTCLAIYSYSVNAGCPLEETLADPFPWCDEWEAELKRLFAAYVAAKQRDNVLDYDDLLLYWHEAVQMPFAAQMRADFDHILVDEYQDTNRLQAAILRWRPMAQGSPWSATTPSRSMLLVEAGLARVEQRFAQDSPLEGDGFELPVPRQRRHPSSTAG
jgi:superfamily I DNA/RNA helicase